MSILRHRERNANDDDQPLAKMHRLGVRFTRVCEAPDIFKFVLYVADWFQGGFYSGDYCFEGGGSGWGCWVEGARVNVVFLEADGCADCSDGDDVAVDGEGFFGAFFGGHKVGLFAKVEVHVDWAGGVVGFGEDGDGFGTVRVRVFLGGELFGEALCNVGVVVFGEGAGFFPDGLGEEEADGEAGNVFANVVAFGDTVEVGEEGGVFVAGDADGGEGRGFAFS